MKNGTLEEITNHYIIENILNDTLHEMLGIKGTHSVVPFSYPGWPTSDYIKKLSTSITDAMSEVGERLGKNNFKGFKYNKTKLTPEMIEEVWLEVGPKVAAEIYRSYESPENSTIPGLDEALEKGAIVGRNPNSINMEKAERDRKMIKERAAKINDLETLLLRFRDKYFDYMKKEFGIFAEQSEEVDKEFQPKIH